MSTLTKIYCPKCSQAIEADGDLLNEQILCPSCGAEFVAGENAPDKVDRMERGRGTVASRGHAMRLERIAVILLVLAGLAFVVGIIQAMVNGVMTSNGAAADAPAVFTFSASWFLLKISGACYAIAQLMHIRANTGG